MVAECWPWSATKWSAEMGSRLVLPRTLAAGSSTVVLWGAVAGNFEREAAALAGLALDANSAAVLLQNLLAHRQAEAGAAAAFVRDEDAEDAFEVVLRDAGAVVVDADAGHPLFRIVLRGDDDELLVALVAGVDGVGDDVEHRAVDRLRDRTSASASCGPAAIAKLDLGFLGARLHQLDHVAD